MAQITGFACARIHLVVCVRFSSEIIWSKKKLMQNNSSSVETIDVCVCDDRHTQFDNLGKYSFPFQGYIFKIAFKYISNLC